MTFRRLSLLAASCLAACATPPVEPPGAPPGGIASRGTAPEMPLKTLRQLRETPAPEVPAVDAENSVFFPPAGVLVDEAGEALLRRHAERLKEDSQLRVMLIGHTDDLGSRPYNLAIADRRVHAVYQLLRKYGVPPQQLRRGAGGERSIRPCAGEDCRRLQRRVELRYSGKP